MSRLPSHALRCCWASRRPDDSALRLSTWPWKQPVSPEHQVLHYWELRRGMTTRRASLPSGFRASKRGMNFTVAAFHSVVLTESWATSFAVTIFENLIGWSLPWLKNAHVLLPYSGFYCRCVWFSRWRPSMDLGCLPFPGDVLMDLVTQFHGQKMDMATYREGDGNHRSILIGISIFINPHDVWIPIPIGSMYAIYGNIDHQYTPNVSIYTIHGSYGIMELIGNETGLGNPWTGHEGGKLSKYRLNSPAMWLSTVGYTTWDTSTHPGGNRRCWFAMGLHGASCRAYFHVLDGFFPKYSRPNMKNAHKPCFSRESTHTWGHHVSLHIL